MSDFAAVTFPGLGWSFNVPSVAAQFNLPFLNNPVTIKFYGIIIAFGFALAVLFGGRMAYKWKMSIDKMLDVLIFGTLGGILGARLYYVAFEWDYYSAHLSEIPQIWMGGLAIYGGLIGGIVAAAIVCRFNKLNFLNLLDMAGMSFLIGQGIGRWGNFMNQEAFGTNTTLPWGMTSDKVVSYINSHQAEFAANGITMDPHIPVHPTFLYESIWCILGFFVLWLICSKARKFSGQIILCYGVWYGLERMVVEGMRTDSLYIAGTTLRVSQLLSGALAAVCAILLVILLIKYSANPKPVEGVDFYINKKGERIEMKNSVPVAAAETESEADENGADN